jgi:ribonucleoside-diphosphate reductase alpha chain
MMAAVQPFLSGAISKTINMPEQATVEEVMEAYIEAWRLGLKAVAIYRDGSKKSQPLSSKGSPTAESKAAVVEEDDPNGPPRARRNKLPDERRSITHKFSIAGHEGYITVGLYPNDQPGEIFITMAKEGSTVSGLMDSFATAVSIALQHGVPLKLLCEKLQHLRFEPSGWSQNEKIGFAKSIMDYIFRWIEMRFLTGQQQSLFDDLRPRANGSISIEASSSAANERPKAESASLFSGTGAPGRGGAAYHAADALSSVVDLGDAPSCPVCGAIMTRNGSCYRCISCGSTSGCS